MTEATKIECLNMAMRMCSIKNDTHASAEDILKDAKKYLAFIEEGSSSEV